MHRDAAPCANCSGGTGKTKTWKYRWRRISSFSMTTRQKKLAALEESALTALQRSDAEAVGAVAQSLLISKLPALGILLGRGVIPLLPTEDAASIFQQILKARDRLNLSPDDPFSDIIDAQLIKHRELEHEKKDAAALRAAPRNLELAQVQRDLDLRESARNATQPRAPRGRKKKEKRPPNCAPVSNK